MLAARAAATGSRRLRPSPARLSAQSWIIRSCPYSGGSVGRATSRPAAEFERHPAFRQLDRDLDEAGVPCFPARGEDVRVLNDPGEFYQTLLVRLLAGVRRPLFFFGTTCGRRGRRKFGSKSLTVIRCTQDKIRTAKRRIFIASLYIGKEEKELVRPFLSPKKAPRELILHNLRPGPNPARSPARKPRLATDDPSRLPPLDARTAPCGIFRLFARFAHRRVPEPGRHPVVPYPGVARMAEAVRAETIQRGMGAPAHEVLRV